MNILYYCWNENTSTDILSLFQESGFHYTKISYPLVNYDHDADFESQIERLLTQKCFDFIFTFNYFPILSKIADTYHLPYACWIYDCPHLTLFFKRVSSPNTWFFPFDREMCHMLTASGAVHVCHLPLAVNTARLNTLSKTDFMHPVSFVGSLYENNPYRHINYLPEHLRGYLEGIMRAQQTVWGFSFLDSLLTKELLEEIQKFLKLEPQADYAFALHDIFLSILEKEITCRDRIELLSLAAANWETHLYTASDSTLIPDCLGHGAITYTEQMPQIFHHTKINLNISLRSIHSGIPLRCMDIMGAGGFLLSNYQPELAEYFIPDEEFVFFESAEDMLEKIAYYLSHDKKRLEIAQNGWTKMQTDFSYPIQFRKILETIFSSLS